MKPKLIDIKDMLEFNPIVKNGLTSVSEGKIFWTENNLVTCKEHGACLCLNNDRTLWRCPTCHEGAYVLWSLTKAEVYQKLTASVIRELLVGTFGEKDAISGDGESFCLDKRNHEEIEDDPCNAYGYTQEEIMKAIETDEDNRLYPSDFFPEECSSITSGKQEKFKFKIIVIAVPTISQNSVGGKNTC